MTNLPERFSLLGIIRGLMLAENLGDVHDEVNLLHDLVGLPRPDGGYLDGWTDEDWQRAGAPTDGAREDR